MPLFAELDPTNVAAAVAAGLSGLGAVYVTLKGQWQKDKEATAVISAKQRADAIAELERTVTRQETKIERQDAKIEKLEAENDECAKRAAVQDGKISHLEDIVVALKAQNAEQAQQIAELKRVLSAVERDGRYVVRPSGGYVVPSPTPPNEEKK